MEIDAKATSISIKVIGLKLKQPNAKQEQADSANSQNSRYQSSESFKFSQSKSSGSSGYCGKPNSEESSPHQAEKQKDSCDSIEDQIDEITERNKSINNEMSGCDTVVACEYAIHCDEPKQTHEVILAIHENETHNKVQWQDERMETNKNHARIDDTNTTIHIDFEKVIDLSDNYYHQLIQADGELPMVVEETQGYSDDKLNCRQPESFCCTVSMHDGTIVAVTEHMTNLLGFSHDSWIGQPFVNFLHSNDCAPFANKMRCSIRSGSDYGDGDYDRRNPPEKTTYALMRCNRLFESHTFGIPCKKVIFKPFKLVLHDAPMMPCENMSVSSDADPSLLRFICAIEIKSIYNVPDEDMSKQNQRFSTKHTATGILVHIDGTAMAAIGYLPHEIIDRPIFDFYHLSDLSELRNVYEKLSEPSSNSTDTVSGQPYRFLIKNGCYITIETKWTRTINPWTRKVEFIIGAHCILKGPKHCNIFTKAENHACIYSDDMMKNAERIRNEIARILAQPIPLPPANKKLSLPKQCLELTKYMEKFQNEVQKKALPIVIEGNLSHSQSPIILGALSPRYNSRYDDSENSSETPPTYQMLNYQENLNRYFNSDPVEPMPPDFDLTDALNEPVFKLGSAQRDSDESGGWGISSTNHMASVINTSGNSNPDPMDLDIEPMDQPLTSELIHQHTENMEIMLIKSHKKRRYAKNNTKASRIENSHEINNLNYRNPPIKRSHPSTSASELDARCPKHQYKDVTQRESQPERLVGPINHIALQNNFNFVPMIHYVSATAAPANYANDVEGIRLNENDRQTFANSSDRMPSLISRSNAQNTNAIQYMNNLLNQSRHLIYPYSSVMFGSLPLPALHTNVKETEVIGQITNQPECLSKRTTATVTKVEKCTTSDETEYSCSTFYSSQLRTVQEIKIEKPTETWYEDKMRSQRLPWAENVYVPDFGYRIQPHDPDSEIESGVKAMKHTEQSNLVGDQLTLFLSGPAFNGRDPFVSLGDTSSDSGDDEISTNLISVQCQSVEALFYEENASFP